MRAICIDIEDKDDVVACKRYEYNRCCQECDDKNCSGCDYRFDRDCIAKSWIKQK